MKQHKKLIGFIFSALALSFCVTSCVTNTEEDGTTDAETKAVTAENTETETETETDAGTETEEINRGQLSVSDVTAWIDYPDSDFVPVFSDPAYKEALTYEYDESAIQINGELNTVKALKEGDFEVKATSEHFEAKFTVHARAVDKTATDNNGQSKWSASTFEWLEPYKRDDWNTRGKAGVTTVFVGDSFFDSYFWSNFYDADYYEDYEAIILGIGGSTTYDWEDLVNGWFGETDPKNIVMHLGTNNVYDDGDDTETTIASLQRLFTMIHTKLPNAKIYWFSISQRNYDQPLRKIVKNVNKAMKEWCDQRDYITYIHTVDTLTTGMLRDGIHPLVEYYTVFRDALKETDIEIIRKEAQ